MNLLIKFLSVFIEYMSKSSKYFNQLKKFNLLLNINLSSIYLPLLEFINIDYQFN